MYKVVVVTAVKEEDAELGRLKACMQYYFENPVDAVRCYQNLASQPEVVYVNICEQTRKEKNHGIHKF